MSRCEGALRLYTTGTPGVMRFEIQASPDPIGVNLSETNRAQLAGTLLAFAEDRTVGLFPITTPDPHSGTLTFLASRDGLAISVTVAGRSVTCLLGREQAAEIGQEVAL